MNTFCRINSSCNLILPDGSKKLFYCNYYNSTELYNKFYYYKTIKGFFMFSFDNDQNIDIFIEFGDEIIVNYPSKYLSIKDLKDTKLISSLLANSFEIEIIRTFPSFKSINNFTKNDNLIYENVKFNTLLYDIVFDQVKDNKIYKYNTIKKFLNENVNERNIQFSLISLLEKNITYKEFIKKIFQNDSYIKYLNMSLPTNIYNCHYMYNASEYLLNNNIINFKSMISMFSMFSKEINLDVDDSTKIDFNRENSMP